MKTPRELLLENHRSAASKLDSIRHDVLACLPSASAGELRAGRSFFRELLLPFHWHLAGLSAAWTVIVLLNLESSPTAEGSVTKNEASPSRQLLTALRENRRQIVELLGREYTGEPAPEPPAFVPKRRGEIQSTNSMA
jgi:hypothetical protein